MSVWKMIAAGTVGCAVLAGAAWGEATWIGESMVVANGGWYNASKGQEQGQEVVSFNGADLGPIGSLTLGGQVKTTGDARPSEVEAAMFYSFDDLANWQPLELTWYQLNEEMDWYQSGGPTFTEMNVDLSGLAAGEHTVSVYFQADYDPTTGRGGIVDNNIDGQNYVATFTLRSSAVPEPGVVSLLVAGGALLWARRRKGQPRQPSP